MNAKIPRIQDPMTNQPFIFRSLRIVREYHKSCIKDKQRKQLKHSEQEAEENQAYMMTPSFPLEILTTHFEKDYNRQ
jgi:hypothetical protein